MVSAGRSIPRTAHRVAFLRNWLKDPCNVAAIAPTGQSVARLMATGLGPGDKVVERGAGTGTITQAILDAGVYPCDLHAVELNSDFARILKSRFPAAHILQADAESLLEQPSDLRGSVDFVISGLPILWFDKARKTRILTDAFHLLGPAGCFHQITYRGRPPVGSSLLLGMDPKTTLLGFSPFNLPPAFAFGWQKAGAAALASKSTPASAQPATTANTS